MEMTAGTLRVKSVIQEEKIVEWEIDDFLQLTDNRVYSPEFRFSDSSWKIAIYPYGLEHHKSCGFIGLNIYPVSLPEPLTVTMTLGFKTVNGKSDSEDTSTKFIDKLHYGFYRHKVISRADLMRRESELLPSGALTVICTLKESEPNVVKERQFLDASVQTGEIAGSASVIDEVTQKKKGIEFTKDLSEYKVLQDFKELYLKQADCDVIIKVKEQQFPAHQAILKARSPVLCSTFQIDMKEKATGVVDIDDCDPSSFSDFLCFLYCGEVENLSAENVFALFTTADKYGVVDLRSLCLKFIKENLTVETFCDTISLALLHLETELIELCNIFFAENIPKIIVTVKWQLFLKDNPTESNELLVKALASNKNWYIKKK